jgi:hypothetical protein
LISSRTELKIFKGLFDDAVWDVNVDGMEGERMVYPLAYVYCLVGRIVHRESKVCPEPSLLGFLNDKEQKRVRDGK